eukprot:Blabericola_migrator_1__7319@NODE_3722_length_1555_cov_51_760753_g2310_i0_p1_GENE_NODE_3722_length_1555_cov_51_760753_g2310_i0NODE_3722_length_1555_cov_51_760753_g2310_i0_p1_ORF_typecomplete_len311_score64_00_NODE_3722_length_1555_cov_51_760753_g2310_i05361468
MARALSVSSSYKLTKDVMTGALAALVAQHGSDISSSGADVSSSEITSSGSNISTQLLTRLRERGTQAQSAKTEDATVASHHIEGTLKVNIEKNEPVMTEPSPTVPPMLYVLAPPVEAAIQKGDESILEGVSEVASESVIAEQSEEHAERKPAVVVVDEPRLIEPAGQATTQVESAEPQPSYEAPQEAQIAQTTQVESAEPQPSLEAPQEAQIAQTPCGQLVPLQATQAEQLHPSVNELRAAPIYELQSPWVHSVQPGYILTQVPACVTDLLNPQAAPQVVKAPISEPEETITLRFSGELKASKALSDIVA